MQERDWRLALAPVAAAHYQFGGKISVANARPTTDLFDAASPQ